MVHYRELLTYIKSAVTRNHSEKSINSILDYVSVSKNVSFCVHYDSKFTTSILHTGSFSKRLKALEALTYLVMSRMHSDSTSGISDGAATRVVRNYTECFTRS